MGDWADERAQEWMAEKWLSNEDLNEWEASLAALLREVKRETAVDAANVATGMMAEQFMETKQRTLAEIRHSVKETMGQQVLGIRPNFEYESGVTSACIEILSRLDKL